MAIAYSTKDRIEYSRQTAPHLLNDNRFDFYWFDGSMTEDGRRFALEACRNMPAACELHHGVTGGPDAAILYAMSMLRGRGYDWIILVENDVLVERGWYEAMMEAVEIASSHGFSVGGASARVLRKRVLSVNAGYTLLFNAGAGFHAFTPDGVDAVLRHYRTTDTQELRSAIRLVAGIDIADTWEFARESSDRVPLCSDWHFDAALYLHGMVVVGPPRTAARNIDHVWHDRADEYAGDEAELAQSMRYLLPHASRLRNSRVDPNHFQTSPISDRLLVPCHRLLLDRSVCNGAPVVLSAGFQRRWSQFLGPFEFWGTGSIVFRPFDCSVHCLLHTRQRPARLSLWDRDGQTCLGRFVICADRYFEYPIARRDSQDVNAVLLRVDDGEIGFIGLTMLASAIPSCQTTELDLAFLQF